MRITGIKILLKATPAMFAMFAVALGSQQTGPQAGQSKLPQAAQPVGPPVPCPPIDQLRRANLLKNASFEQGVPPSWTFMSYSPLHWGAVEYSFQPYLPSLDGGGQRRLYVRTTGPAHEGVIQAIQDYPPPTRAFASAWVYVINGKVCIGAGTAVPIKCDATSNGTGKWELLKACNGSSPAARFWVVSSGGPAEFYVDLTRMIRVQ